MIETMSPRVVAKAVAQHRVSHMLVLPGFAEIWNDSGFMAAEGSAFGGWRLGAR